MTNRRLAVAATCTALAVIAAALHTPSLPRAGAQAAAPPLDMVHLQSLYSEKCSACHNLPDAKEKGYTRREWRQTVNQMLTKYKASDSISPTEADQIVAYLATFAVPDRASRGPLDPWATDAVDVWTEIPTVSRVFNFETPGVAPDLAPVEAGTAGPASNWHIVSSAAADGSYLKEAPVRPTASRFGLLMDRANSARNLDVRIRFKIVSGTVSPAVGIVFGFTNPKAYDVLRYDAHHDTLSLMTMNEPTHTTLQQTSLTAPDPTAAAPALAASVTPPAKPTGDGWHTLRLLVRDGQIRGWLDMNKRISIADSSDTTGKIGLWAQGDTVATFSDWTIDIYDTPPTVPTPNVQGSAN